MDSFSLHLQLEMEILLRKTLKKIFSQPISVIIIQLILNRFLALFCLHVHAFETTCMRQRHYTRSHTYISLRHVTFSMKQLVNWLANILSFHFNTELIYNETAIDLLRLIVVCYFVERIFS